MKKRGRRGQSSGAVGTLVAIIGLIIILYVLFLPPEEREKLLGDDDNGGVVDDDDEDDFNRSLLKENPGLLQFLSFDEYEHNIPSINLFSTTEANILKEVNSLYVKKGVFDQINAEFEFEISDLQNIDNAILSFSAKRRAGILTIKLNNDVIFSNEIPGKNVDPIKLEDMHLSGKNTMSFSVSDVGLAFWKVNEYLLENLQIVANLREVGEQKSRNTFVITKTEKDNADSARLRFVPECTPGQVGMLTVYLNRRNVYSAVPDCGIPRPLEFSKDYLQEGENEIMFSTDKGHYLIDQISITTELADVRYPSYYFDISSEEMQAMDDNELDARLAMTLFDDGSLKEATIYVNGWTTSMSTRKAHWARNITHYIEKGNNGIKIVPDGGDLEIVHLRVDLMES